MSNFIGSFSGFSVDDLEKAKEFYTKTLGLELKSEEMGLEIVLPAGNSLFIYDKADHQPATYTTLNFVVENIDEALDDLESKGVTFEHYEDLGFDAKQDEKGILRGLAAGMGPDITWFKDPAGNVLSILQDK